jgi:hypothetical protein
VWTWGVRFGVRDLHAADLEEIQFGFSDCFFPDGAGCCHVERRHGGSEEKALLCVSYLL